MNRGAAVAAVSLAVLMVAMTATPALAAVAPEATPQVDNSSEAGFDSPGPFEISELRRGGDQPSAAPPSVRYVSGGNGVDGAVAVRYQPADPLSNEPVYLESGQTLNTDEIELYSTVFGESTGEYELVVVYWQRETEQVNGSTVEYAARQEVQRASVTIEDGYASAPVALNSHYDEAWQATAWLEQDGERVEGAQWRFEHASAPASQQIAIDTQADAWWYAFRTAILPGVASIIVGFSGAKGTLKLAGSGPRYSLAAWGVISVFGVVGVLAGLYYEVATVVANLDILMGLSLLPIAYGAGLRMSPPTERIAFERKELTDAVSLRRGETEAEAEGTVADGGTPTADSADDVGIGRHGYHDELFEEEAIKTTIRTPAGDRLVPKRGIRPFFARLFASAAKLDLTDLKTKVKVEGSSSEKVYVDPEAEAAVEHFPAHLRRRMPVWHRLPEADEGESLSPLTRGLYGILTLATVAAPLIGWKVGAATMNTPTVGAAVGLVILAVESYEAVGGSISFTPAPRHDISADASLTVLQREHADGRTLEDTQEQLWEERVRTTEEVQEHERRRDDTMAKRNVESTIGFEATDDRPENADDKPETVEDDDE